MIPTIYRAKFNKILSKEKSKIFYNKTIDENIFINSEKFEYNKKYEPIPSTIIGRWQGDSIAIVGDYAKSGLYDMCEDEDGKPKNGWKDISIPTYRTLLKDTWIGSRKAEEIKKHGTKWMFGEEHKLMLELFPKECTEGDLRQKFDFVEKEQSEE